MSGTIPPLSIQQSPELGFMWFSSNVSISGTVPSFLLEFATIGAIDVADSHISGTISQMCGGEAGGGYIN